MCQALCLALSTQLSYRLCMYPSEMATGDPILQKRMPGLIVVEYLEQLTLETTLSNSGVNAFSILPAQFGCKHRIPPFPGKAPA